MTRHGGGGNLFLLLLMMLLMLFSYCSLISHFGAGVIGPWWY